MTIEYKTLRWLGQIWTTKALVLLAEGDLDNMQSQVVQIAAINRGLYEGALAEWKLAVRNFREIHPRKSLPSTYRKPDKPPKLVEQWQTLLARRSAAIRKAEREAAERRETFLDRMDEGRYRAMQRREKAVRDLIARFAAERGIQLSEKATDKRLSELFDALSIASPSEV